MTDRTCIFSCNDAESTVPGIRLNDHSADLTLVFKYHLIAQHRYTHPLGVTSIGMMMLMMEGRRGREEELLVLHIYVRLVMEREREGERCVIDVLSYYFF